MRLQTFKCRQGEKCPLSVPGNVHFLSAFPGLYALLKFSFGSSNKMPNRRGRSLLLSCGMGYYALHPPFLHILPLPPIPCCTRCHSRRTHNQSPFLPEAASAQLIAFMAMEIFIMALPLSSPCCGTVPPRCYRPQAPERTGLK